jgi:hypothetical protein
MKAALTAPLFLCFLSVCSSSARADEKKDRETLRGITGIVVLVADFGSDAKSDGLTSEQVQTDTELRLRKAGVRVLTLPDVVNTRAFILFVHPTFLKDKSDDLYAVECQVSLDQYVTVAANGVGTSVSTWSDGGLLIIGTAKMSTAVRNKRSR